MSHDPLSLVSVAPGAALPEWTLAWANVWIDRTGGQHWTCYSHGTTFEAAFEAVMGRPVDHRENNWMFDNVGSVGDAEDDDDNPGWQFNELAVRSLGWIRIKGHHLDGLEPSWTVTCDEGVTREALAAARRLISTLPREAVVEMEAFGGFAEEMPPGKASRELREMAEDAPSFSDDSPEQDPDSPSMRR